MGDHAQPAEAARMLAFLQHRGDRAVAQAARGQPAAPCAKRRHGFADHRIGGPGEAETGIPGAAVEIAVAAADEVEGRVEKGPRHRLQHAAAEQHVS